MSSDDEITSEESIPVSPQRSGVYEDVEEEYPAYDSSYPPFVPPAALTPSEKKSAGLPRRRKGSIVVIFNLILHSQRMGSRFTSMAPSKSRDAGF